MKIRYCQQNLENAACFIGTFSATIKSSKEARSAILNDIYSYATNPDAYYVSGFEYTITFERSGNNFVFIEIYVNPDILFGVPTSDTLVTEEI